MPVRTAHISEWNKVKDFCTDTFAWGDYIEQVWDAWAHDGNLLAYETDGTIQGICNVTIRENEAWIEGVRVRKTARHHGIGMKLLSAAQKLAISAGAVYGRSGIETTNTISLHMYESSGYAPERQWHMYKCDAQPNIYEKIHAAPKHIWPERYVDSWMWFPPNDDIPPERVVYTPGGPVIILTDSKRFPNTVMATISSKTLWNNTDIDQNVINYISNFAHQSNQSIQIFSTHKIHHKLLHKHDSTISVVVKRFTP